LESPLNGTLGSYARLNDEFVVTRRRNDADVVLGLGQKTGRMNRNGRHFTLWNTDVLDPSSVKEHTAHLDPDDPRTDCRGVDYDPYYISIPFYQGLDSRGRAAGFFVDNVHRGHFEFDHEGETRIHFVGGQYVEYVFAGPSLQSILSDYTELTGRMSAPPMWALGYHHCRWHPYDQADVLEIAATYRKKGIPCDSIWLDIDHMDGYRVFTWNKAKFPDPPAMLSALKGNGFRTVTIVDPGVKVDPDYSVFQSGLAAKAFCLTEGGGVYEGQVWPGKTAFPDFANERARAWWGALNAQHVQSGLAGIWNDMNEPATGAIPAYPMRFDGGKYSHGTYHNAYALLMAMGTTEGLRKAMPDLRTFVLSRAGSAGIQRYAANWLGDNMSRWDHLWLSLPMSLGLGLSGQPFVGADIGGFGEDCEAELLVRWFQAAALSPFCRHHNDAGGRDQYPWSFDARVEKICHAALDLRYRLMPYLYSAFVESSQSGVPVMRPLVMSDQTDARLPEVDDQYLLGPHLIVAPVVEKGATSREVVLPAGEWIGWWTEVPAKSGAVAAPLDQIPVFARAGAVIPVWPEAPASTLAYRPETIDLHVFVPSQDGTTESMLVEDDGETLGYEQGQRLVTTFRLTRAGDSLSLEATTTGAPFEGWRRTAFRVILRTPGSVPKVVEAGLEGFRWAASL
jgi:alpha-glucosidase